MRGYSFANWTSDSKLFAFTHLLHHNGLYVNVIIVADQNGVDMKDHFHYATQRLDEDIEIANSPEGTRQQRILASVIRSEQDETQHVLLEKSRVSCDEFKKVFLNGAPEEGSNVEKLIKDGQIYVTFELKKLPE